MNSGRTIFNACRQFVSPLPEANACSESTS